MDAGGPWTSQTLMTLKKPSTLSSSNSQILSLVKANVPEVRLATGPNAVSNVPSLIAAYRVMVSRLELVPLHTHWHYGISLWVGSLLFGNI